LRLRLALGASVAVALAAGPGAAFAKVYKCTDPVSRAQTLSDTPCPQAAGPTPGEVAANATRLQQEAIAAEIRQAAVRADRQLLYRFPDAAAHRKAHAADLEVVIRNIRFSAARFSELAAQRKPLDDEAAFYGGKTLPAALQRRIDASDASFDALRDLFLSLRASIADIETKRGLERERLRLLWAGAAPGSLGLLASDPASAAPR
jgi:hypothetical protein